MSQKSTKSVRYARFMCSISGRVTGARRWWIVHARARGGCLSRALAITARRLLTSRCLLQNPCEYQLQVRGANTLIGWHGHLTPNTAAAAPYFSRQSLHRVRRIRVLCRDCIEGRADDRLGLAMTGTATVAVENSLNVGRYVGCGATECRKQSARNKCNDEKAFKWGIHTVWLDIACVDQRHLADAS